MCAASFASRAVIHDLVEERKEKARTGKYVGVARHLCVCVHVEAHREGRVEGASECGYPPLAGICSPRWCCWDLFSPESAMMAPMAIALLPCIVRTNLGEAVWVELSHHRSRVTKTARGEAKE